MIENMINNSDRKIIYQTGLPDLPLISRVIYENRRQIIDLLTTLDEARE